ncbi:MAG: ABC transporter permease [Acidobacteria bacterium]|nr:ABC transporter permease [Acidobacteriota bacterium]MBV9435421.1 ABC transporter permease [Acidobacteriota bacterium]
MENLLGNVRYALRQFRKSPIFTGAAILTLALGIGGTTAIFTLMDAVMLRSLPVADPASLYRIGEGDDCCVESGPQARWGMYSYAFYQRLKESTPEFEQLAAFQAGGARLAVRREGKESAARPLRSEYVTGNYFTTFGIKPFVGRLFSDDDDLPSSAPVAVLSHHSWEATYGADPSIVGSTLVVEGHPFAVIGIAPPGFFGETLRGNPPDLWIPVQQEAVLDGGSALLHQSLPAWLRVIGRLRPGASVNGMSARLTALIRQWMQNDAGYPANWMQAILDHMSKQVINVVPAGAGVAAMKEEYGRSLQILLAVCGLVLLIACANVANLLLARAVARRGQTALRLAIGATRRRMIAQALTESVVLAIAGCVAGLVVAVAAARLLLSLAFSWAHYLPIDTRPSVLVLAFAFAVALLTGIIFGAAPAWFATRTAPAEVLRSVSRSTSDHSSFARQSLLIVQATLSVVLVAGSSMLARSLNKLQHQNFGFATQGRVEITLQPPPSSYTIPKVESIYRELEDRLKRLPGVQGAGLALYNPLTDNWGEMVLVAGHPAPKLEEDSEASWDRVSPDFLQNWGTTLQRGRWFTPADNETTAPVAIVNEAFVKRFFKTGEDPLDQHFGPDLPQNAGVLRIVGVIRDARFAPFEFEKPIRPMFYVPLAQKADYKDALMSRVELHSHYIGAIMLVTNASPSVLEPLVTRVLSDVDPNLTIESIRTIQQQIEDTFAQERAVASLAGLFGIVALVLAAVGLYGVTAYSVAQRTNEIGIRMALGADRSSVMELVLTGAFRRVLLGLAVGLPLAVGAGKLISSQLFGVSFWDPLALSIAALSLAACAFFAAIIPAGRAASISPMNALRTE